MRFENFYHQSLRQGTGIKCRFVCLCWVGVVVCLLILNINGSFDNSNEPKHSDSIDETVRMTMDEQIDTDDDIRWITEQEVEQHRRLLLMEKVCKGVPHGSIDAFLRTNRLDQHPLFIDANHNLLYCKVPKIASTSWIHLFLIIGGFLEADTDMDQHTLNKYGSDVLQRFVTINKTEQNIALRSYTKFLFVRHPFSRILSAYRNKLEPNTTFKYASGWQRTIGMHIISSYQNTQRRRRIYQNFKQNYDLKFKEFVKYIVDIKYGEANAHWQNVYSICRPCTVPYNFIGKMETISEDCKYLMKLAKLKAEFHLPSPSLSSPTNSTATELLDTYYKDVPERHLKKLYLKYKLDFKMFGYPEPDYANHKIIPD